MAPIIIGIFIVLFMIIMAILSIRDDSDNDDYYWMDNMTKNKKQEKGNFG